MIHLSFEQRSSGTVVKTIDFNASGRIVMGSFVPQTAEGESVIDTFDLHIIGSNEAGLTNKVRAIEAMLAFAENHPMVTEGVWVLYSPDSDVTAWQSRVRGGSALLDTRMGALWRENKTRAQVVFERQNYWETQDPVTLKLSNSSVTEQNAAPIDNCQDAGNDLYVEIGDDQVTGVLPTPAILEFTNTLNDATLMNHLSVGVFAADGVKTPPVPGNMVREGSGEGDASCSGLAYSTLSWASDTEHSLKTWSMASGAFLQKRYRTVVRLRAGIAYTDLFLKVKLLAGSTVIAETRWALVPAGDELLPIGSLSIPPYPLGEAIDLGNLTVALYEKRASGGGSFDLDYLILMPQDSWRRYGAISGLAYNEKLIDDPVRSVLVTQDGSDYKITHKVDEGEPLLLRPGVKNLLYFLQDDMDGKAPIDRTASVTVKIHPRRLTV